MNTRLFGGLMLGALAAGGCEPTLKEGFFACERDSDCPSGWFCQANQRCYSKPEPGEPPRDDASTRADGGPGLGLDASVGPDGSSGERDSGAPGRDGGDPPPAECTTPAECPSGEHATATCEEQTCGLTCDMNWGNCDERAASGCEAWLEGRTHCGDCTRSCAADQHCGAGECRTLGLADVDTSVVSGTSPFVFAKAATLDSAGRLFVVGSFSGTFRPGEVDVTASSASGYFVRIADDGSVLTRTFTPSQTGNGGSLDAVAADLANNVYMAGVCAAGVFFGSTRSVPVRGSNEVCVASLGSAFTVYRWQQAMGGENVATTSEQPTALAVSGRTLFVGGNFRGGQFGSPTFTAGTTELTNAGNSDGFLVRLSTDDGSVLGAISLGGTGEDDLDDMAVDPVNGDVLVTGAFENSFTVGGESLTSAGLRDAFLLRFTSEGELIWSKRLGGMGQDRGLGVAVTSDRTIWLYGQTNTDLAPVSLGGDMLTGPGSNDLFVARYDQEGRHLSSFVFGSTGDDAVGNVFQGDATSDNLGNFYFGGSVTGELRIQGTTVPSVAASDAFFASLDPTGALRFVRGVGSASNTTPALGREFVGAIAVRSPTGPLYVVPTLISQTRLELADGSEEDVDDYIVLRYAQ